jgi:two-component system, NtrC family, response regulator HydG
VDQFSLQGHDGYEAPSPPYVGAEARDNEPSASRGMPERGAGALLGTSAAMQQVARLIERLSTSDASVLIEGETGTGKSFVARLIHEASARARGPFRALNCAAIPETLLEAGLFGHEKGAFTGAVVARAGALEDVGRGTLFLDEIGELSLGSQAKLLQVLEERRFERLGSNRPLTMCARVLAATNRDLDRHVRDGRFRSDLLFRFSVVRLRLPSLRERPEDVPVLARAMLADLAARAGRRVTGVSPQAMSALQRYAWPGNVRELRNVLEHALVFSDGPTIDVGDLPEALRGEGRPPLAPPEDSHPFELPIRLDLLERRAIDAALRAAAGNMTRAATLLGIARATLYRKLNGPPYASGARR